MMTAAGLDVSASLLESLCVLCARVREFIGDRDQRAERCRGPRDVALLECGADLLDGAVDHIKVLDKRGRPKRAFGPQTINQALRLLGQILDRGVESEHYLIDT